MKDNVRLKLTAENTAIVLDSTCDVAPADVRHSNWRIVPLHIHFGSESYRDNVDLDSDDFYRRLRGSPVHPHSSQPSPGEFVDCLEALAEYAHIVVLTVSSKLSGTHASAVLAADLIERRPVVVLDGGTVSVGTVLIADAIQRRLERGTSVESIVELVSRVQRSSGYVFTVATLEYLIRGGRVSRTAGVAGELLNAKPILRIADGEIGVVKRVRGRARALAELEHLLVAETSDDETIHTGVVHAECPAEMEQLEQRIRAVRPRASVDHRLVFGPVIGANSGPGSLALAWLSDDGR